MSRSKLRLKISCSMFHTNQCIEGASHIHPGPLFHPHDQVLQPNLMPGVINRVAVMILLHIKSLVPWMERSRWELELELELSCSCEAYLAES